MKADPDSKTAITPVAPNTDIAAPQPSGAVDGHSHYSSILEKIIEHIFIGDSLRLLWAAGNRDIEVLRAEVDAGGYDIAVECRGVLRHIQLKASRHGSSTRKVNVNARLCRKPSGCVVWIKFDPATMALGPFLWLGSAPGEPLRDITVYRRAKHTKANSQGVKLLRANSYEIPDAKFDAVPNLPRLLELMFGPPPGNSPDGPGTPPRDEKRCERPE